MNNKNIIGIDLGTSNCCITYIQSDGTMKIIIDPDFPSSITIPSIISIDNEGILVGNEVNKIHINSNKNIFHSFKRLIGHNLKDIETTNLQKILNYTIIESENIIKCIDDCGKEYYLEELIYFLLNKIKIIIEKNLGLEKWSCIVTIPAYFNEIQRQITMNAIIMAKLPCIKLLNEPTAASFAYLYHNKVLYQETFDKKILVIDFGAGTLDLTVLDINKSDELICEVLGIYGDNNFGGIDITTLIYNFLFNNKYQEIDINTKLKIAEDIKIELSNEIDVHYYSNELNFTFNYKYNDFYSQLEEHFSHKIISVINNILLIAKLNKEQIDEIILVGGSFKIPYFRSLISNFFNKQIDKVSLKLNNQQFLLYEDIAVSLGASVYGYFNSIGKDVVLIERLQLSIGIETMNNQVIKIIERNTIIPITKTKIFTTEESNQSTVTIKIYQGESTFIENCCEIGTFILSNLPPNKPVIFVSIKVDSNGIISVTAKDKRNNTESSIKIKSQTSTLTQQMIDELINKYENNKSNEKIYKNIINNFYQLIDIIDKISYQINFCSVLDDNIIEFIKLDISKILSTLSNSFIINKYNIKINLLQKCAIINNLEFNTNNYEELTLNQIEQFIDMLITLKEYLYNKYNILIIQTNDSILSANQINKLENINEEDNNIDNNISIQECSIINNLKKENILNVSTINTKVSIIDTEVYTIENVIELIDYLKININDFNLLQTGNDFLLNKLNDINIVLITNPNIEITNINNLCIYVKTNYSINE